jgi:hypothetical protein
MALPEPLSVYPPIAAGSDEVLSDGLRRPGGKVTQANIHSSDRTKASPAMSERKFPLTGRRQVRIRSVPRIFRLPASALT